jgi:hypothetical protein
LKDSFCFGIRYLGTSANLTGTLYWPGPGFSSFLKFNLLACGKEIAPLYDSREFDWYVPGPGTILLVDKSLAVLGPFPKTKDGAFFVLSTDPTKLS